MQAQQINKNEPMNYCSECASPVELRIPDGDHLPRHVCTACELIHYSNPRIIAGCLPVYEDKVLLCKRDIEPRLGYWTLPAGFLENGETTEQGAMRETMEEAQARVEILSLYTLTSIVHVNQVQMFYLARLLKPEFGPTSESSEVRLFTEDEIPWDQLAFPTVVNALQRFFADRRESGRYPFYRISLNRHEPETNAVLSQSEVTL